MEGSSAVSQRRPSPRAGALAPALPLHSNRCVCPRTSHSARLALSLPICRGKKVNHIGSKEVLFSVGLDEVEVAGTRRPGLDIAWVHIYYIIGLAVLLYISDPLSPCL